MRGSGAAGDRKWGNPDAAGGEQHGGKHSSWSLQMMKPCSRACETPLLLGKHGVIQGALAFWRVSSMVGSQPGLRIPPPLPRVPRCLTA